MNKSKKSIVESKVNEKQKEQLEKLIALEKQNDQAIEAKNTARLIPVFIGTELGGVINQLEVILKATHPDHVTTILSPKLYQELTYKYDFQHKSEEQKKEIIDLQNNKERQEQSKYVADMISNSFYELPKNFTVAELKKCYNVRKQALSHKQIDELINFLALMGFVKQVDVDVPPHKMRYELVITAEETANQLDLKNAAITLKIAQLTAELEGNEKEIISLREQISTSKNNDKVKDDTLPVKKATAAKSRKKAAVHGVTDSNNDRPEVPQMGL